MTSPYDIIKFKNVANASDLTFWVLIRSMIVHIYICLAVILWILYSNVKKHNVELQRKPPPSYKCFVIMTKIEIKNIDLELWYIKIMMLCLIIHLVYKMFVWFAGSDFRCSSALCLFYYYLSSTFISMMSILHANKKLLLISENNCCGVVGFDGYNFCCWWTLSGCPPMGLQQHIYTHIPKPHSSQKIHM